MLLSDQFQFLFLAAVMLLNIKGMKKHFQLKENSWLFSLISKYMVLFPKHSLILQIEKIQIVVVSES